MMTFRPYQQDASDAIDRSFAEYNKSLLVLPTGGGKTIVFAAKAAQNAGRTLIIAHREELLTQARDKLARSTGIVAELERADSRASLDARVVVASIQTLLNPKRHLRFPANHFSLVIVDEAHHIMADSYQAPLQHFLGGGAKVLGVTATPGTKGKKALGNFFEDIAYEIGLIALIKQGYLSPITVKSFPLQSDRTADIQIPMKRGGDYDQDAADVALAPYLENVVSRLGAEIGTRKTLVFLPLIKTVERFVELCRAHGLTAHGVSGESEDRGAILRGHGKDFQILANSMLLTEGYDDPSISAMMVLRPTRSEILFSQMVGRGTRIHCPWGCTQRCEHSSRKRNLLLLDPLWLHEDMNLVRPAALVTGHEDDRRSVAERVADAQEELDLLELAQQAEHARETALAQKIARQGKRSAKTLSVEEWAVMTHNPDVAEYEPTMRWHEKAISPKQAEFLQRSGFDPATIKGRGHASQIMDEIFKRREAKLATVKQVRQLAKFGHEKPNEATFAEASAFLDAKFSAFKKKEATATP